MTGTDLFIAAFCAVGAYVAAVEGARTDRRRPVAWALALLFVGVLGGVVVF